MMRPGSVWTLSLALGLAWVNRPACGQAPTIGEAAPEGRGSSGSSLGALPGSAASALGDAPGEGGGTPSEGQGADIISGRAGPSVPRVPSSITTTGPSPFLNDKGVGISAPASLPIADVPVYGTLAEAVEEADEGPPDGLTLDMAIERLVRENLDLRSRSFEIPQAQADILTASLRANPIVYADSQLIPYGRYTTNRPGGQTQYDINITYPLDVTHKRQARTQVACQAKRVLEAQYQDAVRLEIDNLYTAYVDVLAARKTKQYAEASYKGLDQILTAMQTLLEVGGEKTRAEVDRFRIQRDAASIGIAEADSALRRTKRTLASLLNLPPDQIESFDLRGTIRDVVPTPGAPDGLVQAALTGRPDLAAYRLGVQRSEADVRLAYANRLQDLYLLYQPYTFQNNEPLGLKSAHSWALGLTAPLPVFNRNQGNIERARLNVAQTQTELAALERSVIAQVQVAAEEYATSRVAVARIEDDLLPTARRVRDDTFRLYRGGEVNVVIYLESQREYNDVVRQYRDTVVRHRRSMLNLNTVVGRRILP